MAPLPYTNTNRLLIEYTMLGQEHVAQLRLGNTGGTIEAAAVYGAIAPLIAAFLPPANSVTGARFGAAGSELTFPLGVTPVTGTAPGTFDTDERPEFISFTGRSTGGRRVRFTVFTPSYNADTQGYRINTPTSGAAALLAELNEQTGLTAIDNLPVVWNSYMNLGYNAYFQRKLRRSG